jgi:hypothetical protein
MGRGRVSGKITASPSEPSGKRSVGFETKAAIVGYIVGGDVGVVDVGSGSLCVGHVVERGWVNLSGRGLDMGESL